MKTLRLHITGKVQGVWYRASAKDKALSMNLKGKVWNNPDGSVGAIVQGPEELLLQYIAWCKEGPMLASVNNVHTTTEATEEVFSSFEIVRVS